MPKRVGLYLRVSTKNGQTVDNQRQAITEAIAQLMAAEIWTDFSPEKAHHAGPLPASG